MGNLCHGCMFKLKAYSAHTRCAKPDSSVLREADVMASVEVKVHLITSSTQEVAGGSQGER